ncbi:hypothetical protein [Sabulibacter ruber]|uniref:hypothetical protein n=1 Tax=Sabulibacter ruber TaxID=2811901 RepID=UPI001A976AAD|nr:hypothetical protein [Sabulibacter ruber]
MSSQILVKKPYIIIQYDVVNDLIYADWSGEQTKESVIDGCEEILRCLTLYNCHKVLNDNTHVKGMWSDAAEWVALDWIPRLGKAGCRFLAHVYSPDVYAKLSADKAVEFGLKDVMVTTFQGKVTAEAWLKAV